MVQNSNRTLSALRRADADDPAPADSARVAPELAPRPCKTRNQVPKSKQAAALKLITANLRVRELE